MPEAVKSERLAMLQQLLGEQQQAFNRTSVGKRMQILLERQAKRPGQLAGRSPWMQSVVVDAPSRLLGQLAEVDILDARPNSLVGKVVTLPEEQDEMARPDVSPKVLGITA